MRAGGARARRRTHHAGPSGGGARRCVEGRGARSNRQTDGDCGEVADHRQPARHHRGFAAAAPPGVIGRLTLTVGKSLTIDSPLAIKRLSTANGLLVEAVAIGPKEVLINGKLPGETSLIIWQDNDARLIYDLTVRMSPLRLNAVREQIARDFPDADINVTFDNDTAFVRGTVRDVVSSDRIMQIVGTLGKAVNLLREIGRAHV